MTFYSKAREGAHVASEAPGNQSREYGVAAPAAVAAIRPGLLVQKDVNKQYVKYDGSAPLAGVAYGYANENGDFAITARLAELKRDRLVYRRSTPTVVTGSAAAQNVSPAGNLSVNGTVIALADGTTPAAAAAAISASPATVTASVVDGKIRLVRNSGGDVAVAGDAGVLADLGLTAGTTFGATPADLQAADAAALAALFIELR